MATPTNKKSFVLYSDQLTLINELSDEQAGSLFKHIYAYSIGQPPRIIDPVVKIAFMSIKIALDRDAEKYRARCEKNRENINRGRYGKEATNVYDRIRTPTKPTDSDSDSDSE